MFLWLCTVIAGPHFRPRASKRFAFEETPLYSWFSNEGLLNASSFKWRQITSSVFFETQVVKYFHDYFGNDFKDCARDLRKLFARRYGEEQEPPPIVYHESFLGVLRKLEEKLPLVETEIPRKEGAEDYEEWIHGIPYCYSSIVDEKVEEILYAVDQADPGSDPSSQDTPARRVWPLRG